VPNLGLVTVLVLDYDAAIAFYVDALGFELVEDTRMDDEKRWVVVAPRGAVETRVLLARASTEAQRARIGDQTGGRVCLFLYTDDFERDYRRLLAARVNVLEAPRHESYGTVVVFEDLYGNRWDLLQPKVDGNDAHP
jgi:catechol 2,3-dioxygenase-like lactoylglutathione lyase family enzyme